MVVDGGECAGFLELGVLLGLLAWILIEGSGCRSRSDDASV
jgi:hypothetical protein